MALLDDFGVEYERAKALHPDLDLVGDSITQQNTPLLKLENQETDAFKLAQFELQGWIQKLPNTPVWEITTSGRSQLSALSVLP